MPNKNKKNNNNSTWVGFTLFSGALQTIQRHVERTHYVLHVCDRFTAPCCLFLAATFVRNWKQLNGVEDWSGAVRACFTNWTVRLKIVVSSVCRILMAFIYGTAMSVKSAHVPRHCVIFFIFYGLGVWREHRKWIEYTRKYMHIIMCVTDVVVRIANGHEFFGQPMPR